MLENKKRNHIKIMNNARYKKISEMIGSVHKIIIAQKQPLGEVVSRGLQLNILQAAFMEIQRSL